MQVYEPKKDDRHVPPEIPTGEEEIPIDGNEAPERDSGKITHTPPARYYVDDVEVTVATERVQYLGADGKLITESLRDYTRKQVRKEYASLDTFLKAWNIAERKQVIVEELGNRGVFFDQLAEQVGRDFDAFDLVCHVAFDKPPLTRRERAEKVRKRDIFTQYGGKARAVLDALLDKFADTGIKDVESMDILNVHPFLELGTPVEIIGFFGGKMQYVAAVHEMERNLYPEAA